MTIIILALMIFVVLMLIGVPISFSLGLSSLAYLFTVQDVSLGIFVQRIVRGTDSFTFLAIPMYILAASFLNAGKLTDRLVGFASALIGHIPGGLAHVNVLASMLFAGVSGSGTADVSGIGRVLMKGMNDEGYEKEFSAAVTASSAIVGPIIPPSTMFVIFGGITLLPIKDLFLAGAIPGVLIGLVMIAIIYYLALKRNYPCHSRFSWQNLIKNFFNSIPVLLTGVIIIVGILSGVFTPTEAGAVAALYAFLLAVVFYRTLKLKDLGAVIKDTVIATSMVMFLLATASTFAWALTRERIPEIFTNLIPNITQNPTMALFLLVPVILFFGCFIDAAPSLVMLTPILLPVVNYYGINLIHFGVFLVITTMVGTITPPVGVAMFVACDYCKVSVGRFAKANMPLLLVILISLALIILFPQLSLWLPSVLK